MHPVLTNLSDTLNTVFRGYDNSISSISGEDLVFIIVLSADSGNSPLFDFYYSSSSLNESVKNILNIT